mgnify:CR=1 FL=1
MKTRLLRKLRKEVNRILIQKGRYVYKWNDIESEGWGKGYNVIYDCISKEQAEKMCKIERLDEMKKITFILRYSKNAKPVVRYINAVRNDRIIKRAKRYSL